MTTAMYTIPATPTASRASPAFETAPQGTLRIAEMSGAVPQRQSYLSVLQRIRSATVAGTALASLLGRAVCDTNRTLAGIVNREGRTPMMREHGNLIVWPSLIAAGLLAVACSDQPNVNMAPKRPSFWFTPPPAQCVTGKWTGGGRIDPTGNRAAANYDNVDEPAGGQPAAPNPPPYMTGKVTFGFNVFLGQDANGNCIVTKGQIQENGHALKVAWHVSIYDGVDAFDGSSVHANELVDGHSGGVCVV